MENLTKRQARMYEYIKTHTSVSNKQIKDFLDSSDESVSRITVVRDIEELLDNGLIKKNGRGRGVVYEEAITNPLLSYVDVEKYFGVDPDDRDVAFPKFNFDVFEVLADDVFSKIELEELEKLNSEYRQRVARLTPAILKKEFERLSIELSWKSSQIEGNTYSLLDTEILIKENKEAAGHTKEEAIMILNHKKALDYILAKKSDWQNVSVAKIENLHKLIVRDMGVSTNVRRQAVGITGTRYQPLDNQFQIEEALEKLMGLLRARKSAPIFKAFVAVLMISYIQPFEDGNKRTARLLGNALLLAHTHCPLSYRSVDEGDYKKAMLLFYEQNNARFFKELFVQQYKFAVDNYFLG